MEFSIEKAVFEHALGEVFCSLDRKHYPESLLGLMERVLLPEKALRGLPLLTSASAGSRGLKIPMKVLIAQEMFLRGWFIQAGFVVTGEDKPSGGFAAELEKLFGQGLLLLAADTLFTLPFEILASGGDGRAGESVEMFSTCYGPGGALGALDMAGEKHVEYMKVNPVKALIQAALGMEDSGDLLVEIFSRYVFWREAGAWWADNCLPPAMMEEAESILEHYTKDRPPGDRLSELYKYLHDV